MNREGVKSLATELRHRLTIQTVTQTKDNEGGYTDVWSDTATYWGALYPIRAAQRFEYKTINVDATHVARFRGKLSIDETQRIKFGSRIFEILTVEDKQERDFELWVTCRERRK